MLGGRYALHFAGWKKHIGLYPVPTLDDPLEAEIAPYRAEKDSVVFPHAQPVPYELIGRVAEAIVAMRRDGAADWPGSAERSARASTARAWRRPARRPSGPRR